MLGLVVVVTVLMVGGLVIVRVGMTLALRMVGTTCIGRCVTERDGWEDEDCCYKQEEGYLLRVYSPPTEDILTGVSSQSFDCTRDASRYLNQRHLLQ